MKHTVTTVLTTALCSFACVVLRRLLASECHLCTQKKRKVTDCKGAHWTSDLIIYFLTLTLVFSRKKANFKFKKQKQKSVYLVQEATLQL